MHTVFSLLVVSVLVGSSYAFLSGTKILVSYESFELNISKTFETFCKRTIQIEDKNQILVAENFDIQLWEHGLCEKLKVLKREK